MWPALSHGSLLTGTPPAGVRTRALFVNVLRRALMARYLCRTTGLAWALRGVYSFIFTSMLRAGAFEGKRFLLFVAVVLWPRLAAQEGLQRATVSLAGYAALIRKVAFPHELVIYALLAATFALRFAGYLAVLVVRWAFGEPVHFAGLLLAIPVWLVLLTAVVCLGLLLAGLLLFIRDVEHVLMPVLMIPMYVTPILYPLTLVPERLRPWVALNPAEPLRLARSTTARCAARRPARAAAGRACGARAVLCRALGVPTDVAAVRGLRVNVRQACRRIDVLPRSRQRTECVSAGASPGCAAKGSRSPLRASPDPDARAPGLTVGVYQAAMPERRLPDGAVRRVSTSLRHLPPTNARS